MSYDIEVYGRVELTTTAMVEFALAQRFVPCRDVGAGSSAVLELGHAGSQDYVFTFAGAYGVEPEDLPEVQALELSGATVLYQITVEGSRGQDVPAAMGFAKMLAAHVGGVVIDLQTVEVSSGDAPEKPKAGRFLHARWFYISGDKTLAAKYLSMARELLPQSVPLRFGTHDPFSGKLPRDGDDGFDRYYREHCAHSYLIIKGKAPLIRGRVSEWLDPVWPSVKLTFALGDSTPVEMRELEEFFVAFARKTGSFFAHVELNEWEYRSSVARSLVGLWPGLPRVPQWLTWFSSGYDELVRPYLADERIQVYPEGIVHRWSATPVSADEIAPMVARRTWLPEKFLPKQRDPEDPAIATTPARVVPESLPGAYRHRRRSFGSLFR